MWLRRARNSMRSLETIATPEVDEAIARVLAAEQAARRDIEQCEHEARQRVQQAQATAHRIAERAARRVARVHLWTDATIAARSAELNAARTALATADFSRPGEAARLERALKLLAGELAEAA